MWPIASMMSFMTILVSIWRAIKKCQYCGPKPTLIKTDSLREVHVHIHFLAL